MAKKKVDKTFCCAFAAFSSYSLFNLICILFCCVCLAMSIYLMATRTDNVELIARGDKDFNSIASGLLLIVDRGLLAQLLVTSLFLIVVFGVSMNLRHSLTRLYVGLIFYCVILIALMFIMDIFVTRQEELRNVSVGPYRRLYEEFNMNAYPHFQAFWQKFENNRSCEGFSDRINVTDTGSPTTCNKHIADLVILAPVILIPMGVLLFMLIVSFYLGLGSIVAYFLMLNEEGLQIPKSDWDWNTVLHQSPIGTAGQSS